MRIIFKRDLEKIMDSWSAENINTPKNVDYMLRRLEKERLYDLKSRIKRPRRMIENGKD